MDFLKQFEESEAGFRVIAEKLMNEYLIQTYNSKFRITELEFYWNSPTHKDMSTYERKYIDPNAGEWFFHYSGVDIALKSKEGRGGILIRKIYDVETKEIYKGPLICAMRLFSGTNAFANTIMTKLVEHNFPTNATIKNDKRTGLGKNAAENGAHNFPYRFFIDINELK